MKKYKVNIFIVQPNRNTYSETFIRNHIKYLPGQIFHGYGNWWPDFDSDDRSLIDLYTNRNFKSKVFGKLKKWFAKSLYPIINSLFPNTKFAERDLANKAFKYYLVKNKIDIVLAEYGMMGAGVMHICEEMKIPLIVHFHGYDAHNNDIIKEFGIDYKRMFEKAAAIISVSNHMHNQLLKMEVNFDKLHNITYGVDTNLFEQTKPSLNNNIIVSVGRFADTKAPYLIILAFAQALKKVPNAELYMVGEGNLLEACKNLADSLNIRTKIHFTHVLTPFEIVELLQKARAFALHSITTSNGDSEGTPNAILEAAASGLPVISTVHAGIPDVIDHEISGFLVEEKDIDNTAKYMVRLFEDGNLADELGDNGRRKVLECFSLEKQIEKLMTLILKSTALKDEKP